MSAAKVAIVYTGGMRAIDAAGYRFTAGQRVNVSADVAKRLLKVPIFKEAPKTAKAVKENE